MIYRLKIQIEKYTQDISSKTRDKRLQCHDWWKIFFDQPVKSDMKTYNNIRKIATGQGDDYTTCYLLDYQPFNKYYKLIAIDLSKQQALDANRKEIQKINFTVNLAREENANTTMFFIIEEVKETILDNSQGTVKVLWNYFTLILYQYKMN